MATHYSGHIRRIVIDGQTFVDLRGVTITDNGDITSDGEVIGHAPRGEVTTVVTSSSVSVTQRLGDVAAGSTVIGYIAR